MTYGPDQKPLDRRTRYTRGVIKETLLDLLRTQRFEKITVTGICKLAEINRGTFYLHYRDTFDVLDDLVDEFLNDTSDTVHHVFCPNGSACRDSLCDRIQSDPEYQPLFLDDTASSRILEKLMEIGTDDFVSYLTQNSDLTPEQAEAVFTFQINGCLAFNRMMLKNRREDWTSLQCAVDRYIGAGLKHLSQS